MTVVKAQEIIPILLGQGLFPQIIQNQDSSITLVIRTDDGVDSIIMANFANTQGLSIKGKVVVIT